MLTQCTLPPAAQPTITLSVNATDVARSILHVHEAIPVRTGSLTLLYPKWIPGNHGPTGPVVDLAGLTLQGGGKALAWRRDLVDMYAVNADVPAGVDTLDLSFDFIPTPGASGPAAGASVSPDLMILNWDMVVMYPSVPRPDSIMVAPSVTLPAGWSHATALTAADSTAGVLRFAPVSLTNLVDSPLHAGRHARRIDLGTVSGASHHISIVADNDAELAMGSAQLDALKRLVPEALALFGSHHYAHYDFLYTLSDHVEHFGLEHHQSSDDRTAGKALIDSSWRTREADLLTHEFVHSWNGKYRRPAGLATGDFSSPMKGDLLWVYEGLTQYLGKVLAARAGLWTAAQFRDDFAYLAASLDNRPGRTWRPIQDVADEAQLLYGTRPDWDSWRRSTDFYDEGALVWLEADVTIRKLTNGAKSIDDFTRAFHGGESGAVALRPYTLDEVISTLNTIAPSDWATFFKTRIQDLAPRAPLGGIEGSGWKLSYGDSPTGIQMAFDVTNGRADARYSLGMLVDKTGTVIDVIPGSPAAKAGVGPAMSIVTVDGRKYSNEVLRDAIKHGKGGASPIRLAIVNGETHAMCAVDYHGGERYPYLERDAAKPDLLTPIIAPAAKK